MTVESPRIDTKAAAQSLDNRKTLTKGIRGVVICILEYILTFLIILEFNTPYCVVTQISNLVTYCIVTVLFFLILLHRPVKIHAISLAIAIGALLPMLNCYGSRLAYIKLYIIFLPLVVSLFCTYIKYYDFNLYKLLQKFSNIVLVISITSLFFWLFGSILEYIKPTAFIPTNWGGDRFIPTYYGLYFETQESMATTSSESLIRNSGIFNEAPMFNMILCTALSVEMFPQGKLSLYKIVILVATILSTLSSTGYLFLIFVTFMKLYLTLGKQHRRFLILITPFILLIGLVLTNAILENKKETGESSYLSRTYDIYKCIEVGLENPLFGVGLFHESIEYGSSKNDYGFSNSLFSIFAHGGLYTFILYFYSLFVVPLIALRRRESYTWPIMILCYFFLFTFTVSQYRYLTILIVGYGLAYWISLIRESNKIINY